MLTWKRHRFYTKSTDYRPIKFPPPGPWWCSGESMDSFVIICYLPPQVPVTEYWPEAFGIDSEDKDEIVFTDRFPKPSWWK